MRKRKKSDCEKERDGETGQAKKKAKKDVSLGAVDIHSHLYQ